MCECLLVKKHCFSNSAYVYVHVIVEALRIKSKES